MSLKKAFEAGYGAALQKFAIWQIPAGMAATGALLGAGSGALAAGEGHRGEGALRGAVGGGLGGAVGGIGGGITGTSMWGRRGGDSGAMAGMLVGGGLGTLIGGGLGGWAAQ